MQFRPVGAGNTVKAINNMMACVNSLAMMEGVVLGRKAGLDPMTVYEVVKASSGGSKALERTENRIDAILVESQLLSRIGHSE